MGVRRGGSRARNNGASLIALQRGTCGGLPNVQVALEQLFGSGGGGTVSADLAALGSLPATVGGLVYVESLLCYFHLNPTSTLTPDGITVIAASGGGNWERIVATTDQDWLAQAAWTIDPVTGDDENAGGALAPLATFDELNRRLSVGPIKQNVTVTIVADADIPDCVLDLDLGEYNLSIVGTTSVLVTDTIATFTARDHGSTPPTGTRITATTVSDWIPYLHARLRCTQGANPGAIAWIGKNVGGGVGTARISPPSMFVPFSGGFTTIVNFIPTDEFVLETLPSIGNVSIRARGVTPTIFVDRVTISSVNLGNEVILDCPGMTVRIESCSQTNVFNPGGPSSGILANKAADGASRVIFSRSAFLGEFAFSLQAVFDVSVEGSYWAVNLSTTSTVSGSIKDSLGEGALTIGSTPLEVVLNDVQIFNDVGAGCIRLSGTLAKVKMFNVSGFNATYGLLIGGSNLSDNLSIGYNPLPNILGNTAHIQIAGSPDLNLSWSDMPYNGNEQKGTDTLAGGTKTVTARSANTAGVVVSRATGAGAARGILEAPTASRTATDFVVESRDATGALVAGDTSTFDWWIPGQARGIRIYQLNGTVPAP